MDRGRTARGLQGAGRLSGSQWKRVVQLNHSLTLRAPPSYAAVKGLPT